MITQISSKEWQLLSDYLDGQITPRDRTWLEQQMAARPELRSGLEELRRTSLILRAAPRKRAPRNFMITRAMAEQIRPQPRFRFLVPAFSFSSALATILLIATFFVRSLGSIAPAAAPAAQVLANKSSPESAENPQATENATPPPIIIWGQNGLGGMGMGGSGGGGDGSTAPPGAGEVPGGKQPLLPTSPTPGYGIGGGPVEPTPTGPALPAGDQQLPTPEPTAPATAATPGPTPQPTPTAEPKHAPIVGTGPILGIQPTNPGGDQYQQPSQDSQGSAEAIPPEAEGPQPIRVAQVILVIIILGTGLAALYFYSRGH